MRKAGIESWNWDRAASIALCAGAGGLTALVVIMAWITFAMRDIVEVGPTLTAGTVCWGILAFIGAGIGWKFPIR